MQEKEFIDLGSINDFIKDAEILLDNSIKEDNTIEKTDIIKKGLFKKEVNKYTIKKKFEEGSDTLKEYNRIKDHIKEITEGPMKFSDLWQFCQFVRWAEKVIFYPNKETNTVCVDSGLLDFDQRKFVLNCNFENDIIDKQIRYLVDEPVEGQVKFLMERTKVKENEYIHSIKIKITRNFGKKMENNFNIIDGNVEYQDTSDIFLMNVLNLKLSKSIREICIKIYDKIYNLDF